MLAACARTNSRQLGPGRRGAGSSFARASRRRMLVGDTRKPSLASSPRMRRCPQRGFSRASRSTSSRISPDSGGRPRRRAGCRHFRRTSARCRRRSVRGVTRSTDRDERGRWQAAAASRARSAAPSFGRATCRRRISSSWRSTSSSMSSPAGRGGYERARQTEPAQRGRGTRRPCRRSSQPSPHGEATPILAPFRGRWRTDMRPP
jgi:hypothetical protein